MRTVYRCACLNCLTDNFREATQLPVSSPRQLAEGMRTYFSVFHQAEPGVIRLREGGRGDCKSDPPINKKLISKEFFIDLYFLLMSIEKQSKNINLLNLNLFGFFILLHFDILIKLSICY